MHLFPSNRALGTACIGCHLYGEFLSLQFEGQVQCLREVGGEGVDPRQLVKVQ